jgi:hypothetical protein
MFRWRGTTNPDDYHRSYTNVMASNNFCATEEYLELYSNWTTLPCGTRVMETRGRAIGINEVKFGPFS